MPVVGCARFRAAEPRADRLPTQRGGDSCDEAAENLAVDPAELSRDQAVRVGWSASIRLTPGGLGSCKSRLGSSLAFVGGRGSAIYFPSPDLCSDLPALSMTLRMKSY